MDDTRNKMTTADVNADTLFEIEFTHKAGRWGTHDTYRPTVAYVVAIKPCGCTGPHLGSIETTKTTGVTYNITTSTPPRGWKAVDHEYELKMETKDRVGLYLKGERLFGKLWRGGSDLGTALPQLIEPMQNRLAWNHYRNAVLEADRPNYPDARLHATVKEALERKPRQQCKLWAVRPDKPYRYGSKAKPVGYVWGKEAAANALHHWWVEKNLGPVVVAA